MIEYLKELGGKIKNLFVKRGEEGNLEELNSCKKTIIESRENRIIKQESIRQVDIRPWGEIILDLLKINNGILSQSDIISESGFDKSKVSITLSQLEEEGKIVRFHRKQGKGRGKIVVLAELSQSIAPEQLFADCQKDIHTLLKKNGGFMWQSDIIDRIGFGKSKISIELKKMKKRGEIVKIRKNKSNLIVLSSLYIEIKAKKKKLEVPEIEVEGALIDNRPIVNITAKDLPRSMHCAAVDLRGSPKEVSLKMKNLESDIKVRKVGSDRQKMLINKLSGLLRTFPLQKGTLKSLARKLNENLIGDVETVSPNAIVALTRVFNRYEKEEMIDVQQSGGDIILQLKRKGE